MNYVFIDDVRVRPYRFGQDNLTIDFPNTNCFDTRSDFIISDDHDMLAVSMTAHNINYGQADESGRAVPYIVSFIDENDERVLASRRLSVRLAPWVKEEHPRVDLFIDPSCIHTDHSYRIDVQQKGRKSVEASTRISFFRPEMEPQDILTIKHAHLQDGGVAYRNINQENHERVLIVFNGINELYNKEELPELRLRLFGPKGNITILNGTVVYDDDTDEFWVEFRLRLDNEDFIGVCYGELEVFGEAVTGLVFSTIDSEDEEGAYDDCDLFTIPRYEPEDGHNVINGRPRHKTKEVIEAKERLSSMVGLSSVKAKITDYTNLVRFNRLRRMSGLPYCMPPLHAMFMGSPGTGKTTVAKIMGLLLKDAGVLSKGHVVIRERATLLGQNYNSEAEKTLEALEEARGGILFIDEAYQLHKPHDPKDPGRQVLDTLMTALADESDRDWMLILAGYTEPMKKMLTLNPGLRSRIPDANHYLFEDYTPEQLSDIAHRYLKAQHYSLSAEAEQTIERLLRTDYDNRQSDFGNARHVMNIIQNGIFPSMARRLATIEEPSTDQLSLILPGDIPAPQKHELRTRKSIGF